MAGTMMEIDLGDGHRVPVEVFVDAAPEAGFLDRLRETREAVLEQSAPAIASMAGWVHRQIAAMGRRAPDRVGVDLGVKFVAKSPGVVMPVVGQLGGETSLVVRLEWDVRPPAPAPPDTQPAPPDAQPAPPDAQPRSPDGQPPSAGT